MEQKNLKLNQSIIQIRVELQKANLKKTGKNKFAGFDYFELADFLPTLNELMAKYDVNDLFKIEEDKATLTLIKGEETQEYSIPFILFDTPVNNRYDAQTKTTKEVKSMQDIQYLGALNTYYKRYLYLNAYGITDGDVIDAIDNSELKATTTKKETQKVKENVVSEDVLQLQNQIITLATELGGSKNDNVVKAIKENLGVANPKSCNDKQKLELSIKVLSELKKQGE